ncbi:hypothetical protein AURDEDRAFT_166600 [Auricularia subglabra TFB-10046 SS5]|nr:hypothetical protein AURDEDRAFT_166600 [Auricularia subglabra TFB-10046 SS5]
MFAPRALVLALAALASAVAAAPSAGSQLEARGNCKSATYGDYTCPGGCCNCDGFGGPGCLGQNLKCFCIA